MYVTAGTKCEKNHIKKFLKCHNKIHTNLRKFQLVGRHKNESEKVVGWGTYFSKVGNCQKLQHDFRKKNFFAQNEKQKEHFSKILMTSFFKLNLFRKNLHFQFCVQSIIKSDNPEVHAFCKALKHLSLKILKFYYFDGKLFVQIKNHLCLFNFFRNWSTLSSTCSRLHNSIDKIENKLFSIYFLISQ